MNIERKWWKEAVIYQVYPRSFQDSNDDGIGDIRGLISKLDYLKDLGIDVIWLGPVYKSPNDDNGYDISDYQDISEEFGTLADWEELISEIHKIGLKIVMDLVVNHTSDEHPWFIESKSSKASPKRDYYIWKGDKEGKEPNNWASFFTPSAWEFDEKTGEYYLHLFSRKQPDLNWENPILREEIYNMMDWWLEKGIDGFRMDVINCISKDNKFLSVPSEDDRYKWGGEYFINGPRVHEYIQEMYRKVLSRYEVMTVGETPCVTPEEAILYVGEDRGELNMLFQFELMDIDSGPSGKWEVTPWNLSEFKNIITKWQKGMEGKGWNSLYLNNHDQPRQVSRFGNDLDFRAESAKMLATLIHTLQGTPYIYQGEEIGMTNVAFEAINDYRDIETLNMYHEAVSKGNADPLKIMKAIHQKGRDNARTPMQWSDEENGGFTAGKPWLKINSNYLKINVKNAQEDINSILHYYKKLIKLRKENLVMIYGKYIPIFEEHEAIISYIRSLKSERILVILNFSNRTSIYNLPKEVIYKSKKLLLSNYNIDPLHQLIELTLRPYEAIVYKLDK